jgi:nicotinate-nucleotide adenylyltransferase
MRIAFFGGTFDPPHCGHLAIARAAADRLRLDKVLFAPVGNQPLKQNSSVAGFDDRMSMVGLAVANDARFEVSAIDAPRMDGEPNYTIDTLLRLKHSLPSEDRLFSLVGADSFLSLSHWHRAAELLFVCDFIVAGRPGSGLPGMGLPGMGLPDIEQPDTAAQHAGRPLPHGVRISGNPHSTDGVLEVSLTNDSGQHAVLYCLPDLNETMSATTVRSSLMHGPHKGDGMAEDVPEQVAEYIRAHHLYR